MASAVCGERKPSCLSGYREFESTSLQQRVHELSVPKRRSRICRLSNLANGYGVARILCRPVICQWRLAWWGRLARRLAPSWWWLGRRTRRWSRRRTWPTRGRDSHGSLLQLPLLLQLPVSLWVSIPVWVCSPVHLWLWLHPLLRLPRRSGARLRGGIGARLQQGANRAKSHSAARSLERACRQR